MPQRVVLIVALAAALRLVGLFIVSGASSDPGGGWFGYVPLSRPVFLPPGGAGPLLVWLVLVAAWAMASVWLLGAGQNNGDN